mmetsp:Transcript_13024/g.36694  ORF Transcript_13024/g.36694 Transcript_13024/m.36694 type:complete len:236 (+) Transcript_13024:658-1365(+)
MLMCHTPRSRAILSRLGRTSQTSAKSSARKVPIAIPKSAIKARAKKKFRTNAMTKQTTPSATADRKRKSFRFPPRSSESLPTTREEPLAPIIMGMKRMAARVFALTESSGRTSCTQNSTNSWTVKTPNCTSSRVMKTQRKSWSWNGSSTPAANDQTRDPVPFWPSFPVVPRFRCAGEEAGRGALRSSSLSEERLEVLSESLALDVPVFRRDPKVGVRGSLDGKGSSKSPGSRSSV